MGSVPSRTWKRPWWSSLYDAKAQSLIWRGIAQNTLNNNGNKNQEMVEKAVRRCSSSGRSSRTLSTESVTDEDQDTGDGVSGD